MILIFYQLATIIQSHKQSSKKTDPGSSISTTTLPNHSLTTWMPSPVNSLSGQSTATMSHIAHMLGNDYIGRIWTKLAPDFSQANLQISITHVTALDL
jgi:hypothetical protein